MESQKVTPVTGAGFDPAYVPGLTSPGPEAVAENVEDTVTDSDESGREVTQEEPEAVAAAENEAVEDAEPVAEEKPAPVKGGGDGPVLEAKDRRGSITVDATGVRFTLDDQEADFTWDEISAVEYGTSRKRLTVTVHTPNSRWFPNDVEAPDKSRLNEWTEQLDKALDAYFED
ncbi:hypothetical protein OKJ48_28050 [Streptomyces kunmingensis]|uniref:Polyketide cyclase / dehydrase and lipid transport n=1 Tax=Streptomyces kunmingensis TaxID=68225 RepID=A0ABU6CH62_9ACTN|nr:hypothetical protein [Streptomyces kunmingensis]MEB3964063.1 hypothetical protein [Streptomyces kunmingensis]